MGTTRRRTGRVRVLIVKVSGVIVTRGNADLSEIVPSLLAVLDEVVVWNNSGTGLAGLAGPCVSILQGTTSRNQGNQWIFPNAGDLSVYGRYAAINWCENDVIYVQDDDVVVPEVSLNALLTAYRPGIVTAIMDDRDQASYPDSALVGFGAVFDRDLPALAFERFRVVLTLGAMKQREFDRICDVAFTGLTPCQAIDLPVRLLPIANGDGRMWRQPGFHEERARALEIARTLRS